MRPLALAAAALLAAAPLAAQQRSAAPWTWTGTLPAGKTLAVASTNGDIRASGGTGNEIRIEGVKRWRRGDPDAIDIRVQETEGGLLVCAVHVARARSASGCDERSNGDWDRNDDVSVEFTVVVPAAIRFDGRTVNGSVEASGLVADARVSSVNGDAEVETKGTAEATTVNGSVHARMGRAEWDGPVDFSSVNGDVTVELAGAPNLDVDASTTNGSIESDFPVTVSGRITRQALHGRIGAGGKRVRLSTVNGSVHIRKLGG